MAKKKDEVIELNKEAIFLKSLNETYGNIVSSGRDLINKSQEIISISPRMDSILGGGIPEATTTFISGPPKSGKTSLILRICRMAQLLGRTVVYIDVEHRLKKMNMEGTLGLDPDKIIHVHSDEENLLNAEKVVTITKRALQDIPRSVVVMDSFGALVTEGEMTGELKGSQRNDLHKLLSLFHRIVTPIIAVNKNFFIGVNHEHANTSGYGAAVAEGGSSRGRYLSDVKLRVKKFEFWEANGVKIGQIGTWVCGYSALGPPGGECQSYIRYGIGIDILQELIATGLDAGLIQKAGAWYSAPYLTKRDNEEHKFQGEAKLYAAISENKEWQDLLEKDLREMGAI